MYLYFCKLRINILCSSCQSTVLIKVYFPPRLPPPQQRWGCVSQCVPRQNTSSVSLLNNPTPTDAQLVFTPSSFPPGFSKLSRSISPLAPCASIERESFHRQERGMICDKRMRRHALLSPWLTCHLVRVKLESFCLCQYFVFLQLSPLISPIHASSPISHVLSYTLPYYFLYVISYIHPLLLFLTR